MAKLTAFQAVAMGSSPITRIFLLNIAMTLRPFIISFYIFIKTYPFKIIVMFIIITVFSTYLI